MTELRTLCRHLRHIKSQGKKKRLVLLAIKGFMTCQMNDSSCAENGNVEIPTNWTKYKTVHCSSVRLAHTIFKTSSNNHAIVWTSIYSFFYIRGKSLKCDYSSLTIVEIDKQETIWYYCVILFQLWIIIWISNILEAGT